MLSIKSINNNGPDETENSMISSATAKTNDKEVEMSNMNNNIIDSKFKHEKIQKKSEQDYLRRFIKKLLTYSIIRYFFHSRNFVQFCALFLIRN